MVKLKKKRGNPFKGFLNDWLIKIFTGIFTLMVSFVVVFGIIFLIAKALIPFIVIIICVFVSWIVGHFVYPRFL